MIPFKLIAYITNKCLETCSFCPYANNREQSEISYQLMKQLIDEMKRLKIFSISYTGGEPTLHSHFFDILSYAKQSFVYQTLASNGRLIDVSFAHDLKKNNIRGVALSLDDSNETDNDRKRGQGSFRSVIRAIEALNTVDIPVDISFTLSYDNLEKIPSLLALLKELNVRSVRLQPIVDFEQNKISLNFTKEIISDIVRNCQIYMNDLEILFSCSVGYFNFLLHGNNISFGDSGLCEAGKNILTIGVDGNVYPCPLIKKDEFCMGNLEHSSLEDIIQNPRIDMDKWIFEPDRMRHKQCLSCQLNKVCKGGCKLDLENLCSGF